MITVKEWMELVEYRITEGSDYYTNIEGLYLLSSWNGEQDGYSFDIAFSRTTQEVYLVEAHDYKNAKAYRIKHPSLIVDNVAWEDVNYIDLEMDDDFIQKAQSIRDGVEYDTRVSVPLTLPDDALFELMRKAHEQDITLNQLVEQVLWEAIRAEESRQRDDDDEGWDKIAEDHWDDDEDEMASDLQDFRPAAKMKKAKKKKKVS